MRVWIARGLSFVTLATVVPAILLTTFALRRPFPPARNAVGLSPDAGRVEIPAQDGVKLVASFVPPSGTDERGCLLLLHGIASSRRDMPGFLRDFPAAGYAVLATDGRAHGDSGGEHVTYGVLERNDVKGWLSWLSERRECAQGVFALGLSMGASILLESLAGENRVRRAAAESPFASFDEIGQDRVHQLLPLLAWLAKPIVEAGILWGRVGYGINLREASALEAAERIQTPILLIHGTADTNVRMRHSEMLLPRLKGAKLWRVDGAGHVGCYGKDPKRYIAEVLAWFES